MIPVHCFLPIENNVTGEANMSKSFMTMVLLILLLLCSSCIPHEKEKEEMEESYSIEMLNARFGYEESVQDGVTYLIPNSITYSEASKVFPAYRLRFVNNNGRMKCYSAYLVTEGGWFYVFWRTDEKGTPESVNKAFYIPLLAKSERIEALHKGDSIQTLFDIDPAAEIILYSTQTVAYSLADNGKVYEISLMDQGENLLINYIEIDVSNSSYLSMILPEDYPLLSSPQDS